MDFALFGCLILGVIPAMVAAESFEVASVFSATDILPANIITGPHHRVEGEVENDGYLNHYRIISDYGVIPAMSTATLLKRIDEINAIARMGEIKKTDEFKSGVAEKAGDVVRGAKGLVTHPVGSITGAVSGVGKLFQRGGENLFGSARSDVEPSRIKDVMGFSKAKRDYAYELGIDVYSREKIVQQHLDDLAWAGYAGRMTASVALMAVPGGAGVVLSVAGGTQLMNKVFRDSAPADLRIMNRKKLLAMNVSPDVTDLFIGNTVFTPREQTLLVTALDDIAGAANRGAFVKFAVLTNSSDVAAFRQRQAQMYSAYNRNIAPIKRFESVGQLAAAVTGDGVMVFNVPLDHLIWTREMADFIKIGNENVNRLGVKDKHLWVIGTVSLLARQQMEQLGWKIHENSGAALNVEF